MSKSIKPVALTMYQEQRKAWTDNGGELISLPQDEQAGLMRMLASVGEGCLETEATAARGL